MFSAGGLALCDAIAAQGLVRADPAAGWGRWGAPDRGGRGAADHRTGRT
jgi:hypothetical protein